VNKPVHTKTFKSGNSVAVRLPKGFAIPEGTEVELDKNGDVVTLRLRRDAADEKARMLKWLAELYALPKPPQVEKREPILFPKRPGL
jgi:antitoxin VapB